MSHKNLISTEIDTIDQLIFHLTKLAAAYRKGYKFCGRVSTGLYITAGIFGCSAALALVPAIPIFVAVAGAVLSVITIFTNRLKLDDKKFILKAHHHKIKQLITKARIAALAVHDPNDPGKVNKEKEKKVFSGYFYNTVRNAERKIYSRPFEMHMKEFRLNRYKSIKEEKLY